MLQIGKRDRSQGFGHKGQEAGEFEAVGAAGVKADLGVEPDFEESEVVLACGSRKRGLGDREGGFHASEQNTRYKALSCVLGHLAPETFS